MENVMTENLVTGMNKPPAATLRDILDFVRNIAPLRKEDMEAAKAHLDSLVKPVGSLGRLEDIACQLFAICGGRGHSLSVTPGLMLTVAGDHGVADRHVSPFPQRVTRQMVQAAINGEAAISVLCRSVGLDFWMIDAGCMGGPFVSGPALHDCRLGEGTVDISTGPAMSRQTCLDGIQKGIALALHAADLGYRTLAIGEMGIANSTVAAALYAGLLDLEPESLVGPGSGALPVMVNHKAQVVHKALMVNAGMIAGRDPVEIMACLGGFEQAIMTGIVLGAASLRLPVLVDGYIATTAAVAAASICPPAIGHAIFSHISAEPGFPLVMRRMAEKWHNLHVCQPLLDLGLRLGEGTGAAMAWPLLCSAARIYNEMGSMEKAGVSATSQDRSEHLAGTEFI